MSRLVAALATAALATACGPWDETRAWLPAAPAAERGRAALADASCGACHRIPGVRAARGGVGPPLDDYARRMYVAGRLPNTPEALAAFIEDPPAWKPGSAMPAGLVNAATARDIAAYLLQQ
jgi:cytochrome c2